LRFKLFRKDLSKVPIVDDHLGVSCDEERELSTHEVNRFTQIAFAYLIQLLRVRPSPELDSGVPSTTHNDRGVVLEEAVNIFYGFCMSSYDNNLVSWQIPLLNVVISASNHKRWLVRAPTYP